MPSKTNHSPTKARIDAKLERNLTTYVAAAGAAGVSLIALSPRAEGKIIYTPANVTITNSTLQLDLNNDGIPDFVVVQGTAPYGSHLLVYPASGNAIRGVAGQAAAIFRGVPIGPNEPFAASANFMAGFYSKAGYSFVEGNWANATNKYLGFKFKIGGTMHYGWARLNASAFTATLTGYAYEDIPNTRIKAGQTFGPVQKTASVSKKQTASLTQATQPATLGLLARGAHGLSIWRRDEEALVAN
jgi:hypothetical protein